jgi:ABC-type nickel/cobalt efflux system permease component RcnA
VSTAVFHTLIPDHWLPFVLVGRARGWSARRTAAVSGLSALLHVSLSIALGLAAIGIGVGSARALGETLERASIVLLVVFGLAYAIWSLSKGGHFHPGGSLLRRHDESPGCEGGEGHAGEAHLHYHADDDLIRGRSGRGDLSIAAIVGLNPCVLILPILVATAERGALATAAVTLAYGAATILLMVGLSVLGVAGSRRLPVPAAARYMEAVSGFLIAGIGVLFWLLEG